MTRTCPHCKATILASALVCPGCKGHLRLGKNDGTPPAKPTWQLEGTFKPEQGGVMEYSIVISVRDERNEEIARQVVNVGSLQGAEKRTLNVTIESSESKK